MIITNFHNKINIKNQNDYDSIVNQINFKIIHCSCNENHCLVIHGYYYRCITFFNKKIRIRVLRVRCTKCGKTHAVLIKPMIPFLSLSFNDLLPVLINNNHYDPSYINYLKSLFDKPLSYIASVIKTFRNLPLIIIST